MKILSIKYDPILGAQYYYKSVQEDCIESGKNEAVANKYQQITRTKHALRIRSNIKQK